MPEVKIKELTDILNDVKTAVDNSAFGPLFMYPDPNDFLNKEVNNLAWSLYLHLITPIMKNYTDYED